MQSASGQTANDAPAPRSRRRRFSPLALGVAAFLTVIALGVMVASATGLYPPKSAAGESAIEVTPTSPHAAGLTVERAGPARRDGDRVLVNVKVTNKVMQAPGVVGTPTPGAPTPAAEQAKVLNGTVKVFLYKEVNGKQEVVGSGVGNVLDLPYGASKTIEVVATQVGDFTDYVAFPDTVWTDKDPIKTGP